LHSGRGYVVSSLCAVFALTLGVAVVSVTSGAQLRYGPLEAEVKAAYLLNFTRYVEWPVESFSDAKAPMVIGVLGHDPLGRTLDRTIDGRTSAGREVVVRRIERPADAVSCHLIFISHAEEEHLAELLRPLAGRPILTVGESDRFFDLGGGINLVIVEESVRFKVNLRSTQAAGLRVSSRMLALAIEVVGTEGSEGE
jgi:hypothetical protein